MYQSKKECKTGSEERHKTRFWEYTDKVKSMNTIFRNTFCQYQGMYQFAHLLTTWFTEKYFTSLDIFCIFPTFTNLPAEKFYHVHEGTEKGVTMFQ